MSAPGVLLTPAQAAALERAARMQPASRLPEAEESVAPSLEGFVVVAPDGSKWKVVLTNEGIFDTVPL